MALAIAGGSESKKEHFAVKSKRMALAIAGGSESKKEHFAVKSKPNGITKRSDDGI